MRKKIRRGGRRRKREQTKARGERSTQINEYIYREREERERQGEYKMQIRRRGNKN